MCIFRNLKGIDRSRSNRLHSRWNRTGKLKIKLSASSICLIWTFMQLVTSLGSDYRGIDYHLINKNCNHFTEKICQVKKNVASNVPKLAWLIRLFLQDALWSWDTSMDQPLSVHNYVCAIHRTHDTQRVDYPGRDTEYAGNTNASGKLQLR